MVGKISHCRQGGGGSSRNSRAARGGERGRRPNCPRRRCAPDRRRPRDTLASQRIGGDGIVDRGGELVLGRQAIVDGDQARSPSGREIAAGPGRSPRGCPSPSRRRGNRGSPAAGAPPCRPDGRCGCAGVRRAAMVRSTISPIGAARPPISSMKASYPVRASITVVCSTGGWPLRASNCSSHWVRPSSVRPSTATDGPARILIQAIGMRTARLAALPCSSRAIPFNSMNGSYHPAPPLWSLGRAVRFALPMAEATPDGYASELRREILRSEIQRVQVLAVVLTVLLVTTMTAATLLDRPGAADLPGRPGLVGAAGRRRPFRSL